MNKLCRQTDWWIDFLALLRLKIYESSFVTWFHRFFRFFLSRTRSKSVLSMTTAALKHVIFEIGRNIFKLSGERFSFTFFASERDKGSNSRKSLLLLPWNQFILTAPFRSSQKSLILDLCLYGDIFQLDKWSGAGSASEKSILNVENDKLAFCSRAEEGEKS